MRLRDLRGAVAVVTGAGGDAGAMLAFADAVAARYARVPVLVNNAGVAIYGTVEEVPLAGFARAMRVIFWGALHRIKAFLPLLRRESWAAVVTMSSVYGLIGPPDQAAHAATKFAGRGLSEALRHELAETRVQGTTVHPGGVSTVMAANAQFETGFSAADRREAIATSERIARTRPEQATRVIARVESRMAGRSALRARRREARRTGPAAPPGPA